MGWTFTTVRCWGEVPNGVWSLQVSDETSVGQRPDDSGSRGNLIQWTLTLYGSNITSQEVEERLK